METINISLAVSTEQFSFFIRIATTNHEFQKEVYMLDFEKYIIKCSNIINISNY